MRRVRETTYLQMPFSAGEWQENILTPPCPRPSASHPAPQNEQSSRAKPAVSPCKTCRFTLQNRPNRQATDSQPLASSATTTVQKGKIATQNRADIIIINFI